VINEGSIRIYTLIEDLLLKTWLWLVASVDSNFLLAPAEGVNFRNLCSFKQGAMGVFWKSRWKS